MHEQLPSPCGRLAATTILPILLSILFITACQPQEETGASGNADGAEITAARLANVNAAVPPAPGAESIQAFRRIHCSLQDGQPAVYGWTGRAYSRSPGEPDRLLFRVDGMNIRQCGTVDDPDKGTGLRMVSKEILLYRNPETGAVLDQWENPWTGESVRVLHVANDPVNQPPMFAIGRDGKPFSLPIIVSGDQWWLTSTIPLFYDDPLGGDYQHYVGGKYHATEMFNFMGNATDLAPDAGDTTEIRVGWVRIADWLPWMKMGGRPGEVYFHTAGRKLESYEQLPDIMKNEIATHYPGYETPPPLDDQRPNETSWTYFKKVIGDKK